MYNKFNNETHNIWELTPGMKFYKEAGLTKDKVTNTGLPRELNIKLNKIMFSENYK